MSAADPMVELLEAVDVDEAGQVSLVVPGEDRPLPGLARPAVEVERIACAWCGDRDVYEAPTGARLCGRCGRRQDELAAVYGSLEELERANETNAGGF